MAGSKTRFGFLGSGEEPPDSGESSAARTIIGHDIHLQNLPSGFAPPASPAVSPTPIPPARVPYSPLPRAPVAAPLPRAQVAAPLTEAITEAIPVKRRYPPRQSRIGRLIGRWTTGGHFQSRSRMEDRPLGADPPVGDNDGEMDLPQDTTGRNVLLVLAIAALTFLVTFAIVKLRQRLSTKPTDTQAQVLENRPAPQPAPQPALQPPPPAQAPPQALAPPLAQPAAAQPQPAPARLPPAATSAPHGKSTLLGTPAPATPRAGKTGRAAGASGLPPEHLKGELLPLTP